MKPIVITLLVTPTPKGRPKAMIRNGRPLIYTPSKTGVSEIELRYLMVGHNQFPSGVPVKVTATFFRKKPKGMKKSILKPVNKPDLDNYFKLLCDAMNGFIIHDDSQITSVYMAKRYDMPERIELKVEEDI